MPLEPLLAFTDGDGEYHFPPLETGRPYKVWAQAQAFEAGRAEVALSEAGARQHFTLTPTADFHNQLTGSQWYAALPDGTHEDLRMKEVLRAACMGCHPPNFTLISRFDEAGWRNIIDVMSRMHPYRYGTPAAAARRQPNAIAKFDPSTEEWTSYSLPTIGTKTHGLQAVTVNGRTQIGMGYLGAGKVAKLEFRPREELQQLRAETRQ